MIALSVAKLKMFSPKSKTFLSIEPKKKKKSFLWKVWINADVKKYAKRQEMFFVMSQYVCLTTRCYTTSHLHQVSFDFARIFSLFSLIFRTSNFWSLRNLIKMRLIIASSVLRALLAIYNLISKARSWNNC